MTRVLVARGALAFAAFAPLAYVVQRLFERARGGPGNPLAVVREAHTAFYWRSATALWLAIVAACLVAWAPWDRLELAAGTRAWVGAAVLFSLVLGFAYLYP